MNNQKTIGIDIDGVMYPYYEQFRGYMRGYNIIFPKEPTTYSVYDGIMTRKEYIEYHAQFIGDAHYAIQNVNIKGDIYAGVVSTINKLKKLGYKIVIITSRGTIYHKDEFELKSIEIKYTTEWLYEYKIQHDDLIFTTDKSDYKFDIFIDDSPKILELNKSKKVICRNQSYNKEYKGLRINKFSEILKYAE